MPISDMIYFVLGVADYAFILGFVLVTGLITRKEARTKEKQSPIEANKPAA